MQLTCTQPQALQDIEAAKATLQRLQSKATPSQDPDNGQVPGKESAPGSARPGSARPGSARTAGSPVSSKPGSPLRSAGKSGGPAPPGISLSASAQGPIAAAGRPASATSKPPAASRPASASNNKGSANSGTETVPDGIAAGAAEAGKFAPVAASEAGKGGAGDATLRPPSAKLPSRIQAGAQSRDKSPKK